MLLKKWWATEKTEITTASRQCTNAVEKYVLLAAHLVETRYGERADHEIHNQLFIFGFIAFIILKAAHAGRKQP